MKKIIIVLTILFGTFINVNAQYKTFVFGNFTYETDCFYNKNNFVTIQIKMTSLDLNRVVMMLGTKVQYNSFMNRLILYKTKMTEWDSICIKNNISKTDKMIEFNTKNKENPIIFFNNSFNTPSLLSAYTWSDGVPSIIIHTGEISDLLNKYITCKGGVVIFNSPKDIQEMLDAFDLNKIYEYVNNQNKQKKFIKIKYEKVRKSNFILY